MRLIKILVLLVVVAGLFVWGLRACASNSAPAGTPSLSALPALANVSLRRRAQEVAKAEGIPSSAQTIFNIGPFPVTNSMLVTWVVALAIIIFARIATANMKEVPEGAQNFWEFLVESLHDFLAEIVGNDLIKKTFWFFATIFIFIMFYQLVQPAPRSRHDWLGRSYGGRFLK